VPVPIPVIIENRVTRVIASPGQLSEIREYFAYQPPGYRFSFKYKQGWWNGFVYLLKQSRVPTGLFLEQYREVHKDGRYKFTLSKDERLTPRFTEDYRPDLKERISGRYSFQGDCVEAMMKASRCGGLVLAATGTGKTDLTGLYFSRLQGTGVFVVDELTLLKQAHDNIQNVLQEEVGWLGEGCINLRRITVATAQTLQRNLDNPAYRDWLRSRDVVILDEVHLAINDRSKAIVKTISPKAVFGLTATLEMEKPHIRMEAAALCGPVIFRFPLKEGIDAGVLSRSVALIVRYRNPTLRMEARKAYGQYISNNAARNRCIVSLVNASQKLGMSTVVLVRRRPHLWQLDKMLKLPHVALCGLSPRADRIQAQEQMESGKLRIILSSEIFAKGINIKALNLVIDASGVPGTNAAQQRHGRGTRRKENKEGLIHVDISDYDGRFAAAAEKREAALKAMGVPTVRVNWQAEYSEEDAERLLRMALDKLRSDGIKAGLA